MIGLILDGDSEIEAIPNLVFGRTRHWRSINGNSVSNNHLAKNLANLLNTARSAQCRHVFIISDREKRNESPSQLESAIESEVLRIRPDLSGFFDFIVADRMFENWILANIDDISTTFNDEFKAIVAQQNFEGTSGKAKLKSFLKKRYKETRDGPKFFRAIDKAKAEQNSQSFKKLLDALRSKNVAA